MGEAPVIDVVAAVIWRDGRFLAVDRPEGKPLAGFWEFPGGKIAPGETEGQALTRELREELGITPTEQSFWMEKVHAYEHATVRLRFHHVRSFSGEPSGLEGQRLRWLAPGEPPGVPFLPADEEILAHLACL